MNIRKLLIGTTLCLASQLLIAQNHEAVKYNNRVIKEQHSVTPLIVSFFHNHLKKHIAPDIIRREKEKIETKLDKGIARLQAMEGFEGDTKLRDAAIDWFKLYKRSFDIEYEQVIPILTKKDKTEDDKQKLKTLRDKLLAEEEAIDIKFEMEQEAFAAKHKLTFETPANQSSL
jgi:hypothetical protein